MGSGRFGLQTARVRCVVTAVLTTLAVVAMAAPAHALTWADEHALSCDDRDGVRATFILDPGECRQLSAERLVQGDAVGYYGGHGFDRNFLTWAPVRVITSGAPWSRCETGTTHVGPCPVGVEFHPYSDSVLDGRLTVREWDGAFIALVCGNFSPSGASVPPPSIAGVKYEDMDGDGSRDGDDPGLGGVRIILAKDGSDVASATTAGDGSYAFRLDVNANPDLGPGRYTLREELPAGYEQSARPDAIDVGYAIGDHTFGGNDFGNYRPATIQGTKFDDHDVDRIRDADDGGLAGWTIGLSGGRSPDASDVTGADGSYAFTGLIPGTYVVGETQQAGWRQSAPASGTHTITVRSGDVATGDFGNVCLGAAAASITLEGTGAGLGGVEVRIEEIAIAGVLSNEPALPRTTSGTPTFSGLLPGTYRVVAFLPDRVYTTDPDLTVVDGRLAVVKQITVRECATTDVPIKMFNASTGKVTGGMRMDVPGGFATAGFVFMTRQGVAEGSLEYQDHATGLNLHTKRIEQLYVIGNEAWIGGIVDVDGATQRFALHLVDNGEPGSDDRFELLVANGYRAGYDESIDDGNVQIHPPAHN